MGSQELVDLVRHLCDHPGMYVNPPTLDSVCAFLCGYDLARDGGPLGGFREWLVVRAGTGNNLHWVGLVQLLGRKATSKSTKQIEEIRINELGRLILDYLNDRRSRGLARVYFDYHEWLVKQTGYDESRERG